MTRTETGTVAENRTNQTRARCASSSSCNCGQQLDLCARAHCPRCGRSITHS